MMRKWMSLNLLTADGRPRTILHVLLYLLGAAHWMAFLSFGGIHFGLLDWSQEHFLYSIQKEAVLTGVIPLHISATFLGTDRFFSIPLVVLMPHLLLLRWLPIAGFVLTHVLAFYSAGYLGTLVLASRVGLKWPGFLAFFLLFNFNGYLTSHLAVGHTVWWAGYFLLPFLFLLIFEWLEKGPSVGISLALALVVFLISTAGSFHLCTWSVIFMMLLGLRKRGWLKYSLLTAGTTAILLAYRVFPSLVVFRDLRHGFPAGYPDLGLVAEAFTGLNTAIRTTVNGMGWWEYDIYIGMIGAAFLLVFGLLPLLFHTIVPGYRPALRRLDLPILGMALLSYGEVYWWLLSDFPVLGAERVVTRLLIFPVAMLALLAAMRLDALGKAVRRAGNFSFIAGGALLLLAADLARHSWLWRISSVNILIPHPVAPPPAPFIVARPDAVYTAAVASGFGITIVTLVFVLAIIWKRRRELPPLGR